MPQILTSLELHLVVDALRKNGWAFHSQSGVGLRLSKADPNPEAVFKQTGRRKRQLMVPISKHHLKEILMQSRNVKEAVEQIEAISIGVQLAPEFGHTGNAVAGVDPAVYERLLSQRIENEMAKRDASRDKVISELQAANERLEEKLMALKASAPKGKKQPVKSKQSEVEDEPELTEEEQKLLEQAMRQMDSDE